MRIPSYLHKNRWGIYHFRMSVPKNQRDKVGKTEIKKSLKTRDPRLALHRVRIMTTELITIERNGVTIKVDYGGDEVKESQAASQIVKDLQEASAPALLHEKAQTHPPSPLLSVVFDEYCAVRAEGGEVDHENDL
jgi:hypothetical protein